MWCDASTLGVDGLWSFWQQNEMKPNMYILLKLNVNFMFIFMLTNVFAMISNQFDNSFAWETNWWWKVVATMKNTLLITTLIVKSSGKVTDAHIRVWLILTNIFFLNSLRWEKKMFNIFYFIVFEINWLHLGIIHAASREKTEDKSLLDEKSGFSLRIDPTLSDLLQI